MRSCVRVRACMCHTHTRTHTDVHEHTRTLVHAHTRAHSCTKTNVPHVPQVRIFLDVDDLDDINQLEEYIGQTASVLLFLSRGYFHSKNCQRELQSALGLAKPLILVSEPVQNKGGGPLELLRSECPADLRTPVFGTEAAEREVLQYVRLTAFLRVTMCLSLDV